MFLNLHALNNLQCTASLQASIRYNTSVIALWNGAQSDVASSSNNNLELKIMSRTDSRLGQDDLDSMLMQALACMNVQAEESADKMHSSLITPPSSLFSTEHCTRS